MKITQIINLLNPFLCIDLPNQNEGIKARVDNKTLNHLAATNNVDFFYLD